MHDLRVVIERYGRGLVVGGTMVFTLVLLLDGAWHARPLATLALTAAVALLRAAPVRLSKYSYLTQTATAALAGAVTLGPAPVVFALGVGTLAADLGLLRKPGFAAFINAGREVLAFTAAFGCYAAVLSATGVREPSLDYLPAAVALVGTYFFASRLLFYFSLLVRDKLETEERLLILRYEIVAYVLSLLAASLVVASVRALDPPGWIAVFIVLGLLGLLTRRMVEEAIAAEDLNKVHLMESAVASNLTLEDSLAQIERLAHRLLDWGDLRVARLTEDGQSEVVYRARLGRPDRGAIPEPLPGLRREVGVRGEVLVLHDVHRDPRLPVADPDVQSLVIVPVRFGENVVGTLELEHHKRHFYRPRDLTAAATIATQVATAMHISDLRRPLVATISEIGEQVRALAATTEALRSGGGLLGGAARDLRHSVAQEEAFVAAGLEATGRLAAAARAVAEEADRVARASRAAAAAARSHRAAVGEALERLVELKRIVGDGAARVAALGVQTRGVSGVVASIHEIADLTDLISLNAAIEAARAGAEGRGFAVVADEVRTLAAQSTAAAREAGRLLTGVTDRVEEVSTEIGRGEAAVAGAEELSQRAAEGFGAIVRSVEQTEQEAGRIAAAAAEQLVAFEQLEAEIGRLASVSSRTSTSAAALLGQAEASGRGQQELEQAIRQLEQLAARLQGIARHFAEQA